MGTIGFVIIDLSRDFFWLGATLMQRGWVVSSDYRSAIDAIKAVRIEKGISQRELARRLNKPPSFVNKTEQFERRMDILEFIAIANALDVPPIDLLGTILDTLPEAPTL
jgi:hypothetical protein